MMTEVFFDIETKKLFRDISSDDPADLGVSIVSVYTRSVSDDGMIPGNDGVMQSFWGDNLNGLWGLFQKADRIVGFNTIRFDVPALRTLAPFDITSMPHFDIFAIVRQTLGKNLPLAILARDTLGHTKIDVGSNAVYYWNKGDHESLAKLQKYCEADVAITKELYDFGMKHKVLKYTDSWNIVKEISIDFSYPRKKDNGSQIGLF